MSPNYAQCKIDQKMAFHLVRISSFSDRKENLGTPKNLVFMCFDVVYSTDEKIIDLCRSHFNE